MLPERKFVPAGIVIVIPLVMKTPTIFDRPLQLDFVDPSGRTVDMPPSTVGTVPQTRRERRDVFLRDTKTER
jgi:hypothetical protein